MKAKRNAFFLCAPIAAMMTLSGCETPGQTALAGAATGAAIGGLLHGRGEDALAGAAIGAGAGYLAGHVVKNQREAAYRQGYEDAHYQESNRNHRLYTDRYGDRYYIDEAGRRHYVD